MARTGFSTDGSGSLRLHRPPTPTREPYEDTALPQVTSQQLVVSRRRPLRGSESSIVASHLGGNQRAPPTWQYAHGSIASSSNGHRRTGSTLKTVMRKIFNRKRRSETDGPGDSTPESLTPTSQTPRLKKGGADISFLELQNSQMPQSVSPFEYESDRLHMRAPAPSYRRRATLPSLILSDEGDGHENTFPSLPSSSNVRYSRERRSSLANSDQTDLHRHDILSRAKRRSQSAGALRMMAKEHQMSPIQWRRRSTETTYVNSAQFDTVSDSEVSSRPPTSTTLASVHKLSEQPLPEAEQQDELESVTPDIGNLVNCMQHSEDVSLEQRLTTLEVKLIDLEFAIARMQNARTETPPMETQASKELKTSSSPSKGRRLPRRDLLAHGAPSRDAESTCDEHTSAERPLSTATIRPTSLQRSQTIHTRPSSSTKDFSSISVDQYSALVMLLRREQSARRSLEGQVASLREDIQQLHRLAQDSIPIPVG
ncbi:uncharacterized protein ACLA_094390 [Aspergillus clavatus NRRL 1]|uniref:Uncharacterized protein n=1 Tax=Aspergillus clavatus (strain ATCC 1007 / CBS 513.65 / DSM 816 / NCTC 3887 / NRRL 1 / QM 1276 / 107) TaxID=344612 RepID=A1CFU0_ASPCL|nr:uncharacterized protein ACLA_094390 [Aspergillus clavatus NRRL 1]EAW11739.1 conserved hypothetical protein [Aspergillus clavatus NRRL 1]